MNKKNYSWLIRQSKPAHRWLFISILLGLISGCLMIAQSGILATIIDRVYLHHATRSQLFSFLYWFLCIVIVRAINTGLREKASFQTAKTVKNAVRKNMFNKLLQCTPIQLSQFKTGVLTSKLIEYVEALHGFFSDYLSQMIIAIVLPLIILGVVFTQNWIAGFVLLITAPLIPLFMAFIGINTAKLNQENLSTLSLMSAHFLNTLQGLTTLTLFNRAHTQVNSIEMVSNEYRIKTMRILRVAFLSTATLELFSTIAIAIIAVYLGLGLLGYLKIGFEGVHITLQQALFILLLAPEFFNPLRQLGAFYHARGEAMGAAEELIQLLNEPTDSDSSSGSEKQLGSDLKFEEIQFSYHDHKNIFKNFNLFIAPNECIAITGPSGSGKSTLLNLIAKFISPDTGKITVNHIDLTLIDNDQWREHIALLHQHPRLFYGTIGDNIVLAKPDALDSDIEIAARETGVLDFTLHLPKGLQTTIGEQNFGLSGGQAQRVALARIFLKDAKIILLDEPTAHLDQKNTDIVLRLLEKWRGIKTVIIATHDEKIIRHVDRVVRV